MKKSMSKWRPGMSKAVAPKQGASETAVDLGIFGGGILIGVLSFSERETPLGATMLGVGGSVAAVGLVLLVRGFLLGGIGQDQVASS